FFHLFASLKLTQLFRHYLCKFKTAVAYYLAARPVSSLRWLCAMRDTGGLWLLIPGVLAITQSYERRTPGEQELVHPACE
ncbi:MAG: hypothetical protein J7502_15295, partial [Flavisolibacter sp.]|nr:hypothetical protein [Flavisolibacter sp.]